jgi:cytochrome c biogenesis protein CcmG/thiol:disulfide interchange protein DsbE
MRLLNAVLLLLITAGAATYFLLSRPAAIQGEPLPALSLTELEGRASFDPQALDGPYLLNIWGSWCPPCRAEHPVLTALAAEGVPVYGLNWRDAPEDANRFLVELGDPYRGVMQDAEGEAIRALGIEGAPETLVVFRGSIIARWPGPLTADALRIEIYPALEAAAQAG